MAEPSASSAAATAAAEQTDAERMDALDRMLMRLALADDARLAPVLARVLPYAVTSLASPAPAVRKLVMEILSHINKRVKHRPEISLPMLELWKIYTESTSATMVRNFCIIYIEMAFERLPTEEKGNIAPDLLINISNVPAQHQGIILRLVTKAIGECNTHKVDETIASKYQVITETKDGLVFAEFCFHTLLYQAPPQGTGCPAGLSVAQSERVTGKQPLKIDVLASRKLGILNVIEAMNFAPEIVYPLYLSASSDSQEPVSKKGEEFLKAQSFNSKFRRSQPYQETVHTVQWYCGCRKYSCRAESFPSTCFVAYAAYERFLPISCYSKCISTHTSMHLRLHLRKWNYFKAEAVRNGVHCLGFQTCIDKTDMAIRLFTALRLEDQSLRLTIQEAATSLATAYKRASTIVLKDLEALLLENCEALVSLRYAERINWLRTLLGHVDSDAREAASRLLGIASSALSTSSAPSLLSELTSTLSQNRSSRFENYHGVLCAIGYLTAGALKQSYFFNFVVFGVHMQISEDMVEDVLFAAGEALSFIWGRSSCDSRCDTGANFVSLSQATNYLTGDASLVSSNSYEKKVLVKKHTQLLRDEIIKKLFETLIYSSRKEERCADPKKAIDEHYDAIVEDLLVQSGSRLWRSREASCLALADIIQGRRYNQVCKHLRKIWTTTFRAMDDIKGNYANCCLEDQRLNYVELWLKDSPMWETLDICIKIVDKNSLDLLVPRLAQMVRSAVGLNTRVGVASFITLLVQRVMVDIKPFTTILLKLFLPQAQKLIEDTTSLHSGGKNDQLSGAILIKAYLSNAADILGGYNRWLSLLVEIQKPFHVYKQNFVSGLMMIKTPVLYMKNFGRIFLLVKRVTLTLYLPEIVSLLCDGMSLSSWAGKKKAFSFQSAKAIKKLCDILGEPLSAHYQNILKSLLKELPGRFWEGKDAILDALASLCSCCHVAITAEDSSLPSVILNANWYHLPKVILFHHFSELDESESASISLDKVLNCATSCISVAFPQDIINQKKNVLELILNSLSPEESWQVKLSSFLCIKELCLKFHSSGDSSTWPQDTACLVQELFHLVSPKLVDSIRLVKIAQFKAWFNSIAP
ncbi:unnamed protein product [Miscanthus lutarioriparius]|uniref:ARM repeat superfamily protein n=1 Tax=Miscanthus lutarioriparius TaxID=422564 RepID=A0A811ST65_9POAL|nr:unnamed protein product [Miscanthus lutarioriparius]